jgi:hypothetical protein
MSRAFAQLAAALLAVAPVAAQTYSLRGYLIDGLTNRPISGARLHLFSNANGTSVGSNGPAAPPAIADENGRFSFGDLLEGGYTVQAELAREVVFYEEDTHFILARTVALGPPLFQNREIVIRVLPPGQLSGTLRDENGEAVPESGITAYRRGRRGARMEWILAGQSDVDERGRYRIAGLHPGDYTVCSVPPRSRETYLVPIAERTAAFVAGGANRVYSGECKSGIHVASGEGRPMDWLLPTSKSVTVRSNTQAALYRDDDFNITPLRQPEIVPPPTLRFDFPEVVPGRYVLETRFGDGGPVPDRVAHRRIVVSDEPVQDFDIRPEPVARIDLSTRRDDGIEAEKSSVTVEWLNGGERLLGYGRGPDVYIVDPGVYWLAFRVRSPGCVVSATLGRSDVLHGPATVLAGMAARLEIVLTTQCGSVTVHGATNDQAASFASYLLLLSGTPQEPGDALMGTLDVHGDATIGQLPAGRYRLWTWMNDAGGYIGPDLALASFDTVEVSPGRTASIHVTPGGRR